MQNTSIEVDGLHKSFEDARRLADRRRSMFPRAAALYRMRHAQAWVADVRLILGTRWVALRELGCRAAGGW
jgi:hypothetical protein